MGDEREGGEETEERRGRNEHAILLFDFNRNTHDGLGAFSVLRFLF